MNADEKSLAKTLAVVAVAAASVLIVTELVLPPPPRVPTITLEWTPATNNLPGTVTEVWASSNLVTWTLKTNIAGTNRVTLTATNAAEFFKIRNRSPDGQFSDWSRKTTP